MPKRGSGNPIKHRTHKGFDPSPRDFEVYEAICQGGTLREVGQRFRISKSQVQRVRDKVERYLAPRLEKEIRQLKVRQTISLNKLFADAMESWRMSREGESVEARTGESGYSKSCPLGDVAYFDRAVKAMAEIRKIWNVEKHFEMDGQEALNPAGMPRGEYRRKVAEAKIAELQGLIAELNAQGIE